MIFDKLSNGGRIEVKSKSNRSCNQCMSGRLTETGVVIRVCILGTQALNSRRKYPEHSCIHYNLQWFYATVASSAINTISTSWTWVSTGSVPLNLCRNSLVMLIGADTPAPFAPFEP